MFRFPLKGDYAVGAFSALDFLMRAQRAGGEGKPESMSCEWGAVDWVRSYSKESGYDCLGRDCTETTSGLGT